MLSLIRVKGTWKDKLEECTLRNRPVTGTSLVLLIRVFGTQFQSQPEPPLRSIESQECTPSAILPNR